MYDEDLANLDEWLRRLKVEYGIFFNGNRERPPDDLRMRLERLVKKLSEASNMTYAQRFRFNTLVTRFYVLRDHWRRKTVKQELGDEISKESSSNAKATHLAAQIETPRKAVRISIANPEAEEEKVQDLYNALLQTREKNAKDSLKISYQQFSTYIFNQTIAIRRKYGCSRVTFTIALEENELRFMAAAEFGTDSLKSQN